MGVKRATTDDRELYVALMFREPLLELRERIRRPKWMREAACREHPEVSWFPASSKPMLPARICASCLVRDECLTFALDNHEHHGIWGGTSESERGRMRRGRAA